jgi:hypothetical protein
MDGNISQINHEPWERLDDLEDKLNSPVTFDSSNYQDLQEFEDSLYWNGEGEQQPKPLYQKGSRSSITAPSNVPVITMAHFRIL